MDSEKRLLTCFRAMNKTGQRALLNLAKTMTETPTFTQNSSENASSCLEIIQAYEQALHGNYSSLVTMCDSDF